MVYSSYDNHKFKSHSCRCCYYGFFRRIILFNVGNKSGGGEKEKLSYIVLQYSISITAAFLLFFGRAHCVTS